MPTMTGPARLCWTNFIRGPDQPYAQATTTEFQGLLTDFNNAGLKTTFPARYDALTDANYGAILDSARAAGHDIGIWLEMCTSIFPAAGVDYNASGGTLAAGGTGRCAFHHISRYGPAERKKLVDTAMGAYFARYSTYPKVVGFWGLPADVVQYLRSAYGVTLTVLQRDAWQTDHEESLCSWRNVVWEGDNDYPIMPVRPGGNRSGVALIRLLSQDLIGCYGEPDSPNWGQDHSPDDMNRTPKSVAGYWTPTLHDIGPRSYPVPLVINPIEENGWEPLWNNGFATAFLTFMTGTVNGAAAGDFSLELMKDMASEFLAQSTSDRDRNNYPCQRTDYWFSTADLLLWYQCNKYTARTRWRSHATQGFVAITDLRIMDGKDPYVVHVPPAGNYAAAWISPWIVDASHFYPIDTYQHGFFDRPGGQPRGIGPAPSCLRIRTTLGGSTLDDQAGNSNISVSNIPAADGQTLQWTRGGDAQSLQYYPRGLVWNLAGTATASGQKLRLALTAITGIDTQTQTYSISGTPTSIVQTSDTPSSTEIPGVPDYLSVSYVTNLTGGGINNIDNITPDNRDVAVVFWPLAKTGSCNYSGATATAGDVEFGVTSTASGALTAQVAVVPCRRSELTRVLAVLASNASSYLAGTADPIGPQVQSVAVNSTGDQVTVTFDRETIDNGGWTLICSGGSQSLTPVSPLSGNGTTTHKFTPARGIKAGELIAIDLSSSGNVLDRSGNPEAPLTRWYSAGNASTRTDGYPLFIAAQGLTPALFYIAGPDYTWTDSAQTTTSWGGGSYVAKWKSAINADVVGQIALGPYSSNQPSATSAWCVAAVSQVGRSPFQGTPTAVAQTSSIEVLVAAKFDALPTGGNQSILYDLRSSVAGGGILNVIGQASSILFRAFSNSAQSTLTYNSAPDTGVHVYGLTADGTGCGGWIDGVQVVSGAAIAGTFGVSGNNNVTFFSDTSNSGGAVASIFAILVLRQTMTSGQRAAAVAALLALANGAASAAAPATVGPTAPTITIAMVGNSYVVTTGTATPGDAPVAGYNLYSGTTPGGESGTPIATLANPGAFPGQTPPFAGQSIYYTVKAFDNLSVHNLSVASNEVVATTLPPFRTGTLTGIVGTGATITGD